MAKIIKKSISWDAGMAPDIMKHKVYVEKSPTAPTYGSPYIEVQMPDTVCTAPDDFPAGTFTEDTIYKVGISAVDDVGNESDITVISHPFDFIAPDAPVNIVVGDLT